MIWADDDPRGTAPDGSADAERYHTADAWLPCPLCGADAVPANMLLPAPLWLDGERGACPHCGVRLVVEVDEDGGARAVEVTVDTMDERALRLATEAEDAA